MGCSIQEPPGAPPKAHEALAGQGLRIMHAYGLIDLGEIDAQDETTGKKIRLVRVRNPWGFGEWEGRFGDDSPERTTYDPQIKAVFDRTEQTEINRMDGTFFMTFEDFLK
eukprot:scaffold6348_cov259-Pinguiococcus_pyrenoidosus.AAC.6